MPEKTVAQKLLIKPAQTVLLVNSPSDAPDLVAPLPDMARFTTQVSEPADLALLFTNYREDLERLLPALSVGLSPKASLWVLYHKGTSAVKTDINRDSIWSFAKTIGMTGVSMISVNDDWSAMRLKKIPPDK